MNVLKFGGTSVGSGERIGQVADLVAARRHEAPFVVVSAMGGITDVLLSLGRAALERDRGSSEGALRLVAERHRAAVDALDLEEDDASECREAISKEVVRLSDLSTGVSLLGELSPRTLDAIAASGEVLSSRILAAALERRGVDVARHDPRELLPTDAQYQSAVPDEAGLLERLRRRVVPELEEGRTVVTGGFVGAAPDGSITTLGRGGSDFSAALFGAGLHDAGREVDAIEIWTDVDGILTADPRLVPSARLVPEVGYAEAAELAFFGAKVLHPATIRPAVTRGIPVVVKNTFRPECPGTFVRAEAPGFGVRALATRGGVTALFISNPKMLLAFGYAAKVFGVFERRRVPVDVISTSEVSISVTVDHASPLDELVRDLSDFSEVSILRNLAVVSVVGRGLRTTAGIAARVFAALGDVNVVLISQGASDTNLTFVVDEKDAVIALRRLHAAFFEREEAT
ncbi:MAG TPA: aspartate kinase [Thermoanaerobaculia bacterium]|nr:aspartate kinase [Thermoanaerobaculia bacterium]